MKNLKQKVPASRTQIARAATLFIAISFGAQAQTLPEVKVTGEGETAAGPANGFVARRSATGTKTDTPLLETPQSITVVTREQMEAQAADSLDQAFGYSAGIFSLTGGSQRSAATGFTVRGFNVTGAAPLYLNGSKFPINSLSGTMEPYAYERVELLKGPASILYGQAAPGGIVNLVSKRPTATPLREIELQVGSWNRRQLAFDFAGPLGTEGTLGYRLTGLVRKSETMVQEIPDDRAQLNAALDWKISGATQVTLLASAMQGETIYNYGKPFEGTLLPNPNGRIRRDLFVGEPGLDKFDTNGTTLGYQFEHRLNDSWTVRQNLLAFDFAADNAWAAISTRANAATNLRTVNRTTMWRDDTDDGLALDTQLIGKFASGALSHTLLAGLDWSDRDFSRTQRAGTVGALDLFNPVYGQRYTLGALTLATTDSEQTGFYLQDQMRWNNWIALLGARYDEAKNEARSVAATGAVATSSQKSHAFTPRLGVMYQFAGGVAPYYSYSQSFQPSSGSDFFGRPFEPTEGKQHEVGVKWEPEGANASLTLAAYELTQRNVLTADLAHPGFSVQTGEVRSRGLELEGRAALMNKRLQLTGSVATTDAKVTKSNSGTAGTRPTSVPRNQAALWADWRFDTLPGLSAGVGVRHVGEQEVQLMAVPAYTLFDAALRYQWSNWRFALNVKNLADKDYQAACSFACFPGDERNFTLTARYSW